MPLMTPACDLPEPIPPMNAENRSRNATKSACLGNSARRSTFSSLEDDAVDAFAGLRRRRAARAAFTTDTYRHPAEDANELDERADGLGRELRPHVDRGAVLLREDLVMRHEQLLDVSLQGVEGRFDRLP